ncbi:hypothetical protein AC249_AIPGENE19060 [Exaiptasia diaphana]|nr:hypothetical protein AC249_AIPGENE19060 [Exaiptasia diaphana]
MDKLHYLTPNFLPFTGRGAHPTCVSSPQSLAERSYYDTMYLKLSRQRPSSQDRFISKICHHNILTKSTQKITKTFRK